MRTQTGLDVQHHSVSTTLLEGACAGIQNPATLVPSSQPPSVFDKKGWVGPRIGLALWLRSYS